MFKYETSLDVQWTSVLRLTEPHFMWGETSKYARDGDKETSRSLCSRDRSSRLDSMLDNRNRSILSDTPISVIERETGLE